MKTAQHTEGPWEPGHLGGDGKCQCAYVFSEGYAGGICTVHIGNDLPIGEGGNDAPPMSEAIGNMHLIAAAPDMLAALREARAFMMAPAEDLLWGVIGRLDAAISKAEAS